jgi:hypothetical protein
MSPEAADAEDSLDVVVVCSRSLNESPFTCPVVVLATPELAGQEKGRAASTVMATLPHEGLTSQQLLAGAPSPFRRLSGGQAGGWDIRRGRG